MAKICPFMSAKGSQNECTAACALSIGDHGNLICGFLDVDRKLEALGTSIDTLTRIVDGVVIPAAASTRSSPR
jgi:hypothetical protein